jgi:hypothetical protein
MRPVPRATLRLASALALCGALAACGDAPTSPTSFAQEAGGRTWVAVAVPAGVPDARTWLPYADAATGPQVRALSADAARARRAGRLEDALELEGRAARLAAQAVTAAPPAPRLAGAVSALRGWEERARARLEAGRYPGLDSAVAAVAAHRAAAEAALARGDARAAVPHLADAAAAARAYAPEAVAMGLVLRAEQRIDGDPSPDAQLRRARLLLRLAREAMATGDQTRAMKRAWYALQLIDEHDGRSAR